MLTDYNRTSDWFKTFLAITEKIKDSTPWAVIARQRVLDESATALINLVHTAEQYKDEVLALVKPETMYATAYFGMLTSKLREPQPPLVHLNEINEYATLVSNLTRDAFESSLDKSLAKPGEAPKELKLEVMDEVVEILKTILSRDIFTSLLKPTFDSIGTWERSTPPSQETPLRIAQWAEGRRGQDKQMLLRMDILGTGQNWVRKDQPDLPSIQTPKPQHPIPPASPSPSISSQSSSFSSSLETPPTKRQRRDEIYCPFCKRMVTTHRPETCRYNPITPPPSSPPPNNQPNPNNGNPKPNGGN